MCAACLEIDGKPLDEALQILGRHMARKNSAHLQQVLDGLLGGGDKEEDSELGREWERRRREE